MALILIFLTTPALALVGAAFRGLVLGWPVMILLMMLHTVPQLNWVPDLGFWASVGVVALLGLLIPTSDTSAD